MSWPDPILRLGLYVYRALWWLMLPIIYLYLRRRARADPLYAKHISERFGRATSKLVRPVWIHAVSLGEVRSAVPLIRALLAQGDHVVTTHFTPTGRREAQRVFAPEIIAGQVQVVWMPKRRADAIMVGQTSISITRPSLGSNCCRNCL